VSGVHRHLPEDERAEGRWHGFHQFLRPHVIAIDIHSRGPGETAFGPWFVSDDGL
jgi:hypothetical protein